MVRPGWYDDPEDATRQRWWDGTRWTEDWQGRPAPPPPPFPTAAAPPAPPAGAAPTDPWASASTAPAPGQFAATGWSPAPSRTFPEAIRACFGRYLTLKGRSSRSEYWYFGLFTFLFSIPGNLIEPEALDAASGTGALFWMLYFVAVVAMLPPSIAVAFRRLHDVGKSGWNLFWILLPIAGPVILLVYFVRQGEPGPNQYG